MVPLSNHRLPNSFMSLENPSSLTACSIMTEKNLLFCGLQDNAIAVWDMREFALKKILVGHSRSIICLQVEGLLLFSSSADKTIRVWDSSLDFECIKVIKNYNGHVFSMCIDNGKLYMGNQSTSIRIYDCSNMTLEMEDEFIDIKGHLGYVYSLGLHTYDRDPSNRNRLLFSASGDRTIKVWSLPSMELMTTLTGHQGSVFALEISSSIFSGSQDKTIRCWDIDTLQCKSILEGHTGEVVALTCTPDGRKLCSGGTDNSVRIWNTQTLICLHVLISQRHAIVDVKCDNSFIFSASENGAIEVWNMSFLEESNKKDDFEVEFNFTLPLAMSNDTSMIDPLGKFVGIPCVSGNPSHHQDCWNGAKFLQSMIRKLGAECRLFHCGPGINPIVFGTLGNDPNQRTVLICGHYDVQPADVIDGWDSPPFVLTGRDGYLYGRGATDDKGPIIVTLYAILDCINSSKPHPNFIFLYEGEGENGSNGFRQCIEENMNILSKTELVFISNNYWLGDEVPCITHGMRGCIELKLDVSGPEHDLHSGVDGGAIREPLLDLVALLNLVIDPMTGQCRADGFYDSVRPVTEEEILMYEDIQFDVEKYKSRIGVDQFRNLEEDGDLLTKGLLSTKVLMSRWRQPCITVSNIKCSIDNSSTIPRMATALVGVRTVPNQSSKGTEELLVKWILRKFDELHSGNRISVEVKGNVSWWLGDTNNIFFQTAAKALEKHWKCKPIYVREGGTSQISGYLEKTLKAPCLHFPMGQSSDRAHLQNERIRLKNLLLGRCVLFDFFTDISAKEPKKEF